MAKLKVKAVFFDFDDTLQSRKGAYEIYCKNFLEKYFPFDSTEEKYNKLYEMEALVDGGYKSREKYFPELIDLWDWFDHPPMQELYDSFNVDYGKNVDMLPGAVATLKELKKKGFILGMISNGVSSLQNGKLDTAGIRDLFDVCIVSDDVGVQKPNKKIFQIAMEEAGVFPSDAVYVGDHPVNDVQGALSAGMNVIRVNQGDFFGMDLDNSDVFAVIEEPKQLLSLLDLSAARGKKANNQPANSASRARSNAAANTSNKVEKAQKQSRKGAVKIKIISCICLLLMLSLAVLGSFTDIFDENSSEKTIMFSHLNAEQKASAQSFINKYPILFEDGYDFSKTNFSSVLDLVKPGDESGLFQTALEENEIFTGGDDPARRFEISQSCLGYGVVSKEMGEKLANELNLQLVEAANDENCYYYDGNFYFAAKEGQGSKRLYASVSKSAEINTGDYYLTLDIFDSSAALENSSGQSPLYSRYAVVSLTQFGADASWKVKKISSSPLYSKFGSKIEETQQEGSLEYSYQRRTSKGVTSDDVEFAVYQIEYPKFASDGIAQATAESVYADKVEEFRKQASSADELYKAYVDGGGDVSKLPLTTNVVVDVTYNADGCISIVDKTYTYDPTPSAEEQALYQQQQEQQQEQQEEESSYSSYEQSQENEESEETSENAASTDSRVIMANVEYEGHTFDIESGEFLKKDELIGSDIQAASNLLYEIYSAGNLNIMPAEIENNSENESQSEENNQNAYGENSYSQSQSSSYIQNSYSENEQSQSTADSNGIGAEIYNSPWVLSKDGMTFFFNQGEIVTPVIVPFDRLEKSFDSAKE